MSDFDLDRLGDVWRQQPDPEELERLQKSAAAVAKRARLAQVIDIGAALAVSAVVILLVASNPKLDTILIGMAAILVLLGSNIRLRKLRRVELSNLTGSTEDMLDQSINRVETTLRHHRFALIGVVPAFAVGTLVAALSQGGALLPVLHSAGTFRILWVLLGIGVVVAGILFSFRGLKRNRRELERLRAMRDAYRREHESTGL